MQLGVENRDGESLIENILNEAIHDILEGDEVDRVFEDCFQKPSSLEPYHVNDVDPPNFNDIATYFYAEETQF